MLTRTTDAGPKFTKRDVITVRLLIKGQKCIGKNVLETNENKK